MKYSILAFSLIAMSFFACKDDDTSLCTTCDQTVLGFGISTELCQEGDDVVITVTTLGISSDSTYMNTTVEEQVVLFEASGATCN